MLFQQLRQFEKVAGAGSIARAAAQLRVAQPALSRQIKRLEREVGAPLFERERRGVRLTPAGDALLAGVRDLLVRLETALRQTREASVGSSGCVRVGLGRMALESDAVGRSLRAVRERFPDIILDVSEVASPDQARALRAREVDLTIGIGDGERDGSLQHRPWGEEDFDAAMLAASHPLALSPSLTVEQLLGMPFLFNRVPGYSGYQRVRDAVAGIGVSDVEEHEAVEGVFALVAAGHGWTLCPRRLRGRVPPTVAVVPLRDVRIAMPVWLSWRRADRSRALANVIEQLVSPAEDGSPPRAVHAPGTRALADVEDGQLLALVAALDEGSLSRAAVRLRLTQSGVSRRVHALERRVGCHLIERGTRGVVATSAGAALHAEASAVLKMANDAVLRARQAARGISGTCRIGSLPYELTAGFQLNALQRVRDTYPGINLELAEMLPEQQNLALRRGEIDIGIGGALPGMQLGSRIAAVTLIEDPIECAMLESSHPLSGRSWLTAADLVDETFVFIDRSRGRRVHDSVRQGLESIGLVPRRTITCGGPRAVWRTVASGTGWTVGSRSQRSHPPAGLVAVPLAGLAIPWGITLFWRQEESNLAVHQVLDVFRRTRNPEVAVVVATVRSRG